MFFHNYMISMKYKSKIKKNIFLLIPMIGSTWSAIFGMFLEIQHRIQKMARLEWTTSFTECINNDFRV